MHVLMGFCGLFEKLENILFPLCQLSTDFRSDDTLRRIAAKTVAVDRENNAARAQIGEQLDQSHRAMSSNFPESSRESPAPWSDPIIAFRYIAASAIVGYSNMKFAGNFIPEDCCNSFFSSSAI